MSLKVYYDLLSQPSRAVFMFCKINKIVFEECPIALRKGEHKSDKYLLETNPFGMVPAINHDGFKLIESVAILRYLCREFPVPHHWYPHESKHQAKVDEYLSWQHTNTRLQCAMYFQTKWLIPIVSGEPVNEKRVASFEKGMCTVLDQLESVWLKNSSFIAGEDISIADLLAACELEQPMMLNYDIMDGRPKLMEWHSRVKVLCQPYYEEAHLICRRMRSKFGAKL